MSEFVCENCTRVFFDEELPRRGAICFGCHVKGIHLGFTYGKDNFHGDTIKERQDKQIQDAAASGRQIEPVGTRWV